MAEQRSPSVLFRREDWLSRDALVAAITTLFADQDAHTVSEVRDTLVREISEAGADVLVRLGERFTCAGSDWAYYPGDPLARRIHHVIAGRILAPDSALIGIEHASVVADRPVVLFANHLSYSDAHLLEMLLHRAGGTGAALANRLTVVAGPKVYSSPKRRFSSLCFGTIKTPQSSALSTDDVVMDMREMAHAARRSITIAHERLRLGDALLVFAEGTRSRTGRMHRLLAGVARYLNVPDVWILPVGITGTEALFPVGDETFHPAQIVVRVGRPIRASLLHKRAKGDRRLMMDGVGLVIAELLPAEYRGAYADDAADLDTDRCLLRELIDSMNQEG